MNQKILIPLDGTEMAERAVAPAVTIANEMAGPIQRILLCITGVNSPSRHTLFVARLVSLLDEQSEITILQVMSQISADPGVSESWQLHATDEELMGEHTPEGRLLREDIRALEKARAYVQPKSLHGTVVDEILKEAKRNDYDQIVAQADRSVLVV